MNYEKAMAELIELENTDVITTSSKPGNGYGDDNHNHTGAPGQTGEHPNGKW